MAGTHMHPKRRSECVWFVEHEVSARRAYTGMLIENGRRRIVTTSFHEANDFKALPANFTAVIVDEKNLAEFLMMVNGDVPCRAP